MFHVHPVLRQWVVDNYPTAEKIMTDFGMLTELGGFGILRHQVRYVSNFTGIPTKDPAVFCRLMYELLSPERLRIVLV